METLASAIAPTLDADSVWSIDGVEELGIVWSGHSVGFDYLIHAGHSFVAGYDESRRMTVWHLAPGETSWQVTRPEGVLRELFYHDKQHPGDRRLTTQLPWDSHNYLALGIDADGYLHLSGNMHCDSLVYFRTQRPLCTKEWLRLDRMIGERENQCTYPVFLKSTEGDLIFRYRDGVSGSGADLYNRYDRKTGAWARLHKSPLLEEPGMNAYALHPRLGPDGFFHLVWVWRNSPDCSTNHDICYARSRDLLSWESAEGAPLPLPIGCHGFSVVDPVPPGGGILNGKQYLGFDRKSRPIISYTRYDESGATQAWCARYEAGQWVIRKISDWTYRWEFGGCGSLPPMGNVALGAISVDGMGTLSLAFDHPIAGRGRWILDERDLSVRAIRPPASMVPEALRIPESSDPRIRVHLLRPRGEAQDAPVRQVLRWETLSSNRDRPQEEVPAPSPLRLIRLRRA